MKKTLTLLVISLLYVATMAQSTWKNALLFEELFDKSEQYIAIGQYNEAMPILLKLDSMQPSNANINYKVGLCYMNTLTDKVKSIPYFEKASLSISPKYRQDYYKEVNASPLTLFYLANMYELNIRFEDAIEKYENYKFYISNSNTDELNEVNRRIQIVNNAKSLMASPVEMKIVNLGANINSAYSEYAPVISADQSTLIFTSRRKESTGGLITPLGDYYEDIYISTKKDGQWSKAEKIDSNINGVYHDASLSLSADGRKLFIYRYDGKNGEIYESNLIASRWSIPTKLEQGISTSNSRETHACISPDGNRLYFSSDRAGGFGGKDIYMCKKMPNNKWSNPVNLGPTINTPFDETVPFIHADGKTLYFCSDGHETMGGFDVFKATFENDQWTAPENLGYPINTTDNDYFFVPTADGKHAYYSSSNLKDSYGKFDIYYVEFPQKKETPLRVIVGKVKSLNSDTIPTNAKIVVSSLSDNQPVGVYKPNKKTGKYLFILENGKNYKVAYTASGYFYQEEKLEVPKDTSYSQIAVEVSLIPIRKGSITSFEGLSFDLEKNKFAETANETLNKVTEFLKNNETIKFEILAYTEDAKGKKEIIASAAEQFKEIALKAGVESHRIAIKSEKASVAKQKEKVISVKLDIIVLETK